VVICRTGARSGRAVQQLRAAGFNRVYNLVGGIHRWADEVDPTLPKY
jgi:adenylyltransferase/sulfurtransferase